MLCLPITSASQEPMEVEEDEQEEIQEEEDSSLKALSCIDRVRVFIH